MESVDVCYQNTKAGTYVQFRMPIQASEAAEVTAYDNFLRKSIQKDFKSLIDRFEMDFSTDSSYILPHGEKLDLCVCLLGETTPELEEALAEIGVENRPF